MNQMRWVRNAHVRHIACHHCRNDMERKVFRWAGVRRGLFDRTSWEDQHITAVPSCLKSGTPSHIVALQNVMKCSWGPSDFATQIFVVIHHRILLIDSKVWMISTYIYAINLLFRNSQTKAISVFCSSYRWMRNGTMCVCVCVCVWVRVCIC